MGVDRPITEFFKPLKENKRGRKRRREQDEADESPDAKARKARSSKASSSVLRSTVTANKGKTVDASRVDESAAPSRQDVEPSSSVSPPSIGIGRSSSKPLLMDAGTTLSTPIGSKISALTLHTPPLTGHLPEKRPTVGDARVAAATKRFPDRHALPTPITLPRRRTSRESPPPGPECSQDPPSSPPFKFPFQFPEEIVPSSQPTQDLLRSPRKPASHNQGDDTVFKVPRTPVSRRRWDDEVPSSQSPIALDSDDCVGTSQSQERFPLLGWRSRSTSPVKSRSPVKPVSRHEAASSVADEDTSYQRMLGGSQPLSSPHRQRDSSPPRQHFSSSPPGSPPTRPLSPQSRPLSQYTETEPGSYDYLWNLRSAEDRPAEEDASSQSSSQTIPGTYDDHEKWPKSLPKTKLLPSKTRLRVKTLADTQSGAPSSETQSSASSSKIKLSATPAVTQSSATWAETQPSAPPSETQFSTLSLEIQSSAQPSETQSSAMPTETPSSPPLSPTQPMTCDLWTAEDFAHLRKDVARDRGKNVARGEGKIVARDRGNEDDAHGSRDGGGEAHDEEHEAHDKESEVHDEEASQAEVNDSQAQVNDSQAQFDDSQAGLDDSFGSDFSLGLYAGEGSFPDDFPESLKL